ncbi:efflux RND transporter periplasmic adaptor subunit [Photobacterium sp. ZSDE20]|uniref:Efflux RND transporter periplasmic adaptor subunit n=1 Tax=Photobacterium pectinilyticum TaxID=2906793 RepID=A0ABT1N1V2_9GAMM|nr:efflux RND transporter periplasmic adaptor subunit [Photobacterium sp. ZSDE20]MCQ1058717.1 efflux RND transporter periplasmic adaptor subunit [Photobacterium sp. ZSDE20]MDD1823499.1 efflux RND transporter periplasmic adaptor subunit [Photobacterium sp. ZSDE20]
MKTKRSNIALSIVALAAVGTISFYTLAPHSFSSANPSPQTFRTEQVTFGNVSNRVSATGSLTAVNDVVVGAQLSGQIINIHVDFNDPVEEGQLLAEIDPEYFAAKVAQAQALRDKSQADIAAQKLVIERAKLNYQRSVRELARSRTLYKNKSISEDALDVIETNSQMSKLDWEQNISQLAIFQATHAANEASLQQAQIDLDRTKIVAPISGFVINRTVEAGQTVASSYNTPELFTLAKDLSEMEIEAYIDESDIGLVKLEQDVRFSVDAYPERQFNGQVSQIRKAPQTNNGVISYIVIVSARNADNSLLPGMTANLDISIDSIRNAQRVSNAAVRAANRFASSGQQKGARGDIVSRFEHLNLTEEQKQALRQALPSTPSGQGSPSNTAMRQQRQQLQKVLSSVLTNEQRELQRRIRNGEVKVAPLLVLNNGEVEVIQAQFGVSDDSFSSVLSPDISDMKIVTQVRDNR